VVDIDRNKHVLIADGKVTTQLIDKAKKDQPPPDSLPFTVVKSAHMVYADQTRIADYTGGALMNRPGLRAKGTEIRAFLSEKKDDDEGSDDDSNSRLDKALLDGDVEIVDSSPKRKRTGTGNHAEYYTQDERIILHGNLALLVDSLKGTSTGAELTYKTADEKLEVTKAPDKQVKSHLKRKTR
jgi:hypothetical protein